MRPTNPCSESTGWPLAAPSCVPASARRALEKGPRASATTRAEIMGIAGSVWSFSSASYLSLTFFRAMAASRQRSISFSRSRSRRFSLTAKK